MEWIIEDREWTINFFIKLKIEIKSILQDMIETKEMIEIFEKKQNKLDFNYSFWI